MRRLSLVRALKEGTIYEQGDALVRRYAPGVRLDARQLGGRMAGAWYDHARPDKEIRWGVADGLTVLLHEIGHYRLYHIITSVTYSVHKSNKKIGRKARPVAENGPLMWEEVTAWLWAEEEAKKLGIVFDYTLAEHYFNKKKWHRKRPLVAINWRYWRSLHGGKLC